ncbi:RtcB family protein [Candidatus Falkowbacteria bacterium]|nr:RtcB family protein [Candidatus Falkowbacteria bacterium]
MFAKEIFKKISNQLWEIPQSFRSDMRVPARIYASEKMLEEIQEDRSLEQLVNIATLPGILKYALAMPDIHEGYGFPIGGVAAMDAKRGVISPGGVGYDINCGVRLLTSSFLHSELAPYLVDLANQIARDVPSGVGRGGRMVLNEKDLDAVLLGGAGRMVAQGYGVKEDLEKSEEGGCLLNADASLVSDHAKQRGRDQLGTLGSGNHFLEIQRIEKIFLPEVAKIFGMRENQITVMIHTGSRGLGHQVCTDYVRLMNEKLPSWNIKLPDRELASAPLDSDEGQRYFKAMAAAANFAWANRQMITNLVRQAWERVLSHKTSGKYNLDLVYDVAHNIAKFEEHEIDGKKVKVCLHRKGATRAFGPGRVELPEIYRAVGQPVLIPGSMGTASYVLVGTETAMAESFGSTCHGAGRRMSRAESRRRISGQTLKKELEAQGIIVRCASMSGLTEEAPLAYKDINEVVDVVDRAGLAKKVARLVPLAVVKGE